MKVKTESTARSLARSIAMGVLLSMFFVYSVHVFGTWKIENYRPDPETTSTVLLHNKCAIFGKIHTLRPNTDISAMDNSIDGTMLGGSFMNFFDGHIVTMVVLSLLLGGLIFAFREMKKRNRQQQPAL
ncbi:MAG: hypothetical protein ABI675_20685 [Chitinophagaceae bacterium]